MSKLLSKAKSYLKRSSPTVLTCLGVAGVIGTVIMAVKATPKAVEILDYNSGVDQDCRGYAPTKSEAIKLCWKCYIPTALVGISTIACIVGISILDKRNQASLASAYAMLSQSYHQYQKAANAIFGKDADSRIKAEIAKEVYVSADGYSVYSSDLDAESEKILCYDLFSQRYFTSTMAAVLNAEYHVNRNLCLRGNSNINEFYEFLGLDKIENGDDIIWSLEDLMEGGIMWLDFENVFTKLDDGMECCVVTSVYDPNKFFED